MAYYSFQWLLVALLLTFCQADSKNERTWGTADKRATLDNGLLDSRFINLFGSSHVAEAQRSSSSALPLGLGSRCSGSVACGGVDNSRCDSTVCGCSRGFVPFANLLCIPVARFLGDKCDTGHQCKHLDASAVCYKGHCICEPFFKVAGEPCRDGMTGTLERAKRHDAASRSAISCLPKRYIGAACCDSKQCSHQVYNSECVQGRCQCRAGYVDIAGSSCARKARFLGDRCSVNAQCVDVRGSECHRNSICWTDDDHVPRFLTISKGLSDPSAGRRRRQPGNEALARRDLFEGPCEEHHQCTSRTRNSRCLNARCQCAVDTVAIDERVNLCVPTRRTLSSTTSTNLAETCSFDRMCAIDGAICNGKTHTCTCNEQHFCQEPGSQDKCLKHAQLNEACSDVCQCAHFGGACTSGTCQCAADTPFDSTSSRCSSQRSLNFTKPVYYFNGQFCCDETFESIGQVCAQDSSGQSVSYSVSEAAFSIDSNGLITVPEVGSAVTSSFQLTVSASSSTVGGTELSAQAVVHVRPNSCCTQAPRQLISGIPITIGDGHTTNNQGCSGLAGPAANRATNFIFAYLTTGLINDAANCIPITAIDPVVPRIECLFQFPKSCESQKLSAASFSDTTSSAPSVCQVAGGIVTLVPDFGTAPYVDDYVTQCSVSGKVKGCNMIEASFALTFTLTYPDC